MKRSTKSSLLMSVVAMLLCVSMLVGSTFAWFTDSVTATNNVIVAGNLDVELYYQNDETSDWTAATATSNIFKTGTLWEPGHTEVIKLKVVNEGTLALKYDLGINIAEEISSINIEGNPFKLSDYIKFGVVEGDQTYTREQAVAAVEAFATPINKPFTVSKELKPSGDADDNKIVTLVVYMPETVGNVANYGKGQAVPQINLGLNVFATQLMHEEDSFGKDYDELAPQLTIEVTPANIQEYLDGQHGDLQYVTLQLTPGSYDLLTLGRPTKYEGSNTVYTCQTHDFETEDAAEFNAHLADPVYHTTPRYETTLKDVTILGGDGVTVAGVFASSGHYYGDVYDYVRDIDYDSGSAYYSTLNLSNITFKNVDFTGKIDINTSDAESVYDGVTFDSCSFTTGGTAAANGAAIRYYNEANNGNVRNITVNNCTFNNCYQGIYVHNVNGITVTNNKFDTTGHNAIAIQSMGGDPVDLETVVIKTNVYKNIGDRVLRFGDVGANTNITLEYNLATNSGNSTGEAVKATSIEAGITANVNYNDWGGTVVNPELADVKSANLAADSTSFKSAATTAAAPGETKEIIVLDDIVSEELTYINFASDTVVKGNGNSIVRNSASGNPLLVNTTNKVTFEDFVFESDKGSAALATRKDGANIEINNCVFQSNAAPSTGNTGIQVYAENVTMVFNECEFHNMPIVTNSSYPEGIKLEFNNCTFTWTGANCPGMVHLANYVVADVDFNNCTYTFDAPVTSNRSNELVDTGTSVGAGTTIDFNGTFTMTGTGMDGKIWRVVTKGGVNTGNNVTVTIDPACVATYTYNGTAVDINNYLFA